MSTKQAIPAMEEQQDMRSLFPGDNHSVLLCRNLLENWPAASANPTQASGVDCAAMLLRRIFCVMNKNEAFAIGSGNPLIEYAWRPLGSDGDASERLKVLAALNPAGSARGDSFEAIAEGEAMIKAFWSDSNFLLVELPFYKKNDADPGRQLTDVRTRESIARFSLVAVSKGSLPAGQDIECATEEKFGVVRNSETGETFAYVNKSPLVLRVAYAVPADQSVDLGEVREIVIRRKELRRDADGQPRLAAESDLDTKYRIAAVVLLRDGDGPDHIRLYYDIGFPIDNPRDADWRFGMPGRRYMLYYVQVSSAPLAYNPLERPQPSKPWHMAEAIHNCLRVPEEHLTQRRKGPRRHFPGFTDPDKPTQPQQQQLTQPQPQRQQMKSQKSSPQKQPPWQQ
jgi:hypothetical protein